MENRRRRAENGGVELEAKEAGNPQNKRLMAGRGLFSKRPSLKLKYSPAGARYSSFN